MLSGLATILLRTKGWLLYLNRHFDVWLLVFCVSSSQMPSVDLKSKIEAFSGHTHLPFCELGSVKYQLFMKFTLAIEISTL